MLGTWALYFAITLLVEVPLAAGLAPSGRRLRTALAAALASLTTHPPFTALLFEVRPGWGAIVALEVAIAGVEGVALRYAVPLSWRRALAISAVMNAASALSSPLWWWLLR
ncbi:MAG: hypothetical protein R3F62_01495 [Planctomycetota bacterium]